jgi:hypothetical protein
MIVRPDDGPEQGSKHVVKLGKNINKRRQSQLRPTTLLAVFEQPHLS